MNFKETYLHKAWGDSVEDVTMDDVKTAIEEIQKMDDEHGAFWVGIVEDDELTLEVHKDLTLIGLLAYDSDEEVHGKAKNWEEVETFYDLFLKEQFEELKSKMV
jgi:IMP cyclohydrolase